MTSLGLEHMNDVCARTRNAHNVWGRKKGVQKTRRRCGASLTPFRLALTEQAQAKQASKHPVTMETFGALERFTNLLQLLIFFFFLSTPFHALCTRSVGYVVTSLQPLPCALPRLASPPEGKVRRAMAGRQGRDTIASSDFLRLQLEVSMPAS